MRPTFLLSKWYLDCVSAEGNVFIGYAAEVRWIGLSISYSSSLQYRQGQEVEISTSLRKSSPPRVEDSLIQWCPSHLHVSGRWTGLAQPIKRTLLQSEAGNIEWNCLQPGARAEIILGDSRRIEGTGYVDHVMMTIRPWQLPFDQLWWGRFVSDSQALLWLKWLGANQVNLAFHNGAAIKSPVISDHGFAAKGLTLGLHQSVVLREGPLARTALSMVPGIQGLFPDSILQAYECKWLSRGFLKVAAARPQPGWAIHEIVRFGKAPLDETLMYD